MDINLKKFLTLGVLMVIMTGTPLQAATPEESFRMSFPDIPLVSIAPTAVPDLYEIVADGRILYYAPGPEYLILGEIMTKARKNLTQERNEMIIALKMKALPLEKALKIGNGPRTVIEITDPDCPFCRRASDYFATRNDVTRYVFLYPLPMHPKAEAKIRYIFCAQDRAKAYEEAMTGRLDEMKFTPCNDAAATELVNVHKEIGRNIGIEGLGTPLSMIDGQVVRGANMPQIEKLFGSGK
jgi:thiol:disulfide interchange protein DsbC